MAGGSNNSPAFSGGPEWPDRRSRPTRQRRGETDREAGKTKWSSPPLFVEVQRFRDLWWWKLLIGLTSLAIFGPLITVASAVGVKAGFHGTMAPQTFVAMAIGLGAGAVSIYLLMAMRLETGVTQAGIHVQFRPFHLRPKFYPFGKITSAEAVTYRPLRDYGGWGIRYGRMGWAYNISGNHGVMLKFRDRRNLMIGSLKSGELALIIQGRIRREERGQG